MTPREATLQFLKFFARNYMPLEIPEAGGAPMVMNLIYPLSTKQQ